MTKIVKLGVVGAGSVSLRGILPHLTQEDVKDKVKVTAICDPVPGRAKAAAEKFDVPNAYERYEDLLNAGNVDAVTIASPIGVHYEQGKMAIERGIHVHFNKTMTTTAKEADELIKIAKRRGVKIVASPGEMLKPLHRKIRQFVQDGTLGIITWAATGMAFGTYHEQESIRQGSDVLSNINPAWYYRRPGGGPLYDMTVYGLHAMTGILGPAKRVTAFSGVRIPIREFRGEKIKVDMDDNTLFVLDFGDSLYGFVYGAAAGTLPIVGPLWYPFLVFGTKGFVNGNTLNWWTSMLDFTTEPIDAMQGVKGEYWKANIGLPHVTGVHQT
ncbi:MAG: Gfo/Idh/MocA family oxidoreductase, partial [Candidatus Bathyarchaeia archaeon]